MSIFKKTLSVLLSVTMAFSVFAICATAAVPASATMTLETASTDIKASTDEKTEIITITAKLNTNGGYLGNSSFWFTYSLNLTPESVTFNDATALNYVKMLSNVQATQINALKAAMSNKTLQWTANPCLPKEGVSAITKDTIANYFNMVTCGTTVDATSGNTQAAAFNDAAFVTLKFKVNKGLNAGDKAVVWMDQVFDQTTTTTNPKGQMYIKLYDESTGGDISNKPTATTVKVDTSAAKLVFTVKGDEVKSKINYKYVDENGTELAADQVALIKNDNPGEYVEGTGATIAAVSIDDAADYTYVSASATSIPATATGDQTITFTFAKKAAPLDLTKLQAAVTDCKPTYAEGAYTTDSWDNFDAALAAANAILADQEGIVQDDIDSAEGALKTAFGDLELAEFAITYKYTVDGAAMVSDLAAEVENSNPTTYTAETGAEISAVNVSLAGYAINDSDLENIEVGAFGNKEFTIDFEQTTFAINYTFVDEAGDPVAATTTNPSTYEKGVGATFDDAKFVPDSAYYEFVSANPSEITAADTGDKTVTVTFKLQKADYVGYENEMALSAEITDSSLYTEDSWKAFAEAYEAAQKLDLNLNVLDQDVVDAVTNALTEAREKLVEFVSANYVNLNRFIAVAENLVETKYTAETWADLDTALKAAKAIEPGLDSSHQNEIDLATTNLYTAIESLEWANYDFSAYAEKLGAMKMLIEDEKADDYITATWNAAKEAYDAIYVIEPLTYENEEAITAACDTFVAEFDDLAVAEEANYEGVNAQKAAAEKLNEADYTAESWANLEAAIGAVTEGLNENHQAEVQDMADAIELAISNLVKLADYTSLDALISDAIAVKNDTNYKMGYYTTDSKTAFDNAFADATNLDRFLTEYEQEEVNDAAGALDTAIKGLVIRDADYTTIDALKKLIPADLTKYTSASVKVLTDALAAIKDGKKIMDQAIVNTWASNLEAAIAGLDLKATDTVVQSAEIVDAKTFTFKTDGRPMKLAIVGEDGSTLAYDRYSENATIVSYDSEGNVTTDPSKVAYEEWTVTKQNDLPAAVYSVIAKTQENGWEATGYEFDVAASKDYSCKSTKVEGSDLTYTITVVTGLDVAKISLSENGTVLKTYATGYVDAEGVRTWTITNSYKKGAHTIDVLVKTNEGVVDAEKPVTFTATVPVDPSTEPSETASDYSIATDSEAYKVGTPTAVTIKTPTNVAKINVLINGETYKAFAAGEGVSTDEGNVRTWTFAKALPQGDYTMSFQVKTGKTWTDVAAIEGFAPATFTVSK